MAASCSLRLALAAFCCSLVAQVSALSFCGGLQICMDDEFCCFGRCWNNAIPIVVGVLVGAIVIGVVWRCCCSRRRDFPGVVVVRDQGVPPYTGIP